MKLLSIYIKSDQYDYLMEQKIKHGTPLAETIRRALDETMPKSILSKRKPGVTSIKARKYS